MVGMFSRLYVYRERASNAPLENFLTEALAEVFLRLPADLRISLALVLVPPAERSMLSGLLASAVDVRLETQVSIPVTGLSKRPDLVLEVEGRPLVVVEAKVGAAMQQHEVEDAGRSSGERRLAQHQLRTYAEWIARENGRCGGWPGAITFLTTHTAPPADFIEGRHGGAISAIRSWKDIGDWILREVAIGDTDVTHCALAAELHLFLKERQIMTKYMSSRDIASAALYAPSAASFQKTFSEVMRAVGRHFEKLKGARQIKADYWSEANIYWVWFNFAKSVKRPRSKPYVAFGLCFELSEPWTADAAKLPRDEPFFFMACADDWDDEMPAQFLTRIPAGWILLEEEWTLATGRPLSQFSPDPDARVEELKAWAIGHVDELVGCIPGYATAPVEAAAPDTDESQEDARAP